MGWLDRVVAMLCVLRWWSDVPKTQGRPHGESLWERAAQPAEHSHEAHFYNKAHQTLNMIDIIVKYIYTHIYYDIICVVCILIIQVLSIRKWPGQWARRRRFISATLVLLVPVQSTANSPSRALKATKSLFIYCNQLQFKVLIRYNMHDISLIYI